MLALLLSAVAWGIWACAAALVCRSLGISLSPIELVFVTAVINLGVVIPSSPGFIGTYQWLAVSALGVVGVDGDVAIAFSLLMQAVWFIPTMLVGGVIAIREVHREATRAAGADRAASTIARVKVLLVSFYFPPAGGGGVQRPLKLAQYLPALGIETHVLAPDDPQWIHRDEALRVPTQAWVHRARYIGPIGRKPAEELHGKQGLARYTTQARLLGRRALVPDENVSWNLTAIPAAIRLVREHGIDAVITTSPPNSIHLVGAAVKRATGAHWVADLRDSPSRTPTARSESAAVRAKEKVDLGVAKLVARSADAIVCVSDFIADEVRALAPRGERRHDRRTAPTSTTSTASPTRRASGSGSRTPAASSASATRGRSCRRCTTRASMPSPASSATSAAPTASGPRGSASATGWS